MFTRKTIVGWGIRCRKEKLLSTTMCTLHTAMPECKAVDQLFRDFLCSILLLQLFCFYKSLQEIHLNLFTDISINYNKYIRQLWNQQQQQHWHVQATTFTNTTNKMSKDKENAYKLSKQLSCLNYDPTLMRVTCEKKFKLISNLKNHLSLTLTAQSWILKFSIIRWKRQKCVFYSPASSFKNINCQIGIWAPHT